MNIGTQAGTLGDSSEQCRLAVELPRPPDLVTKDKSLVLIEWAFA